jgi:hypothetical protein
MAEKKYKIGAGKALCTLEGLKGPGEEVKKEHLKTPENFDELVEKKIIVEDAKYIENEDAQYKAPEVKAKKTTKKTKKTNPVATIQGAQKIG